MVHLNRIYTKSGDRGETGLGDGTRVPKTSPRIVAFGEVDELNSLLGVTLLQDLPAEFQVILQRIQNDLFDLGGDLCVPETEEPLEYEPLRLAESQVQFLEQAIDQSNEKLSPLTSFILPGGSAASAYLHMARAVTRRAELSVIRLIESAPEPINQQTAIYLNRLSDLLFVMARVCNNNGKDDILWIPGENR